MANTVKQALDNIANASYGNTVRQAIINAIAACYDNVTNSQTVADAAALGANTAATAANTAKDALITAARAIGGNNRQSASIQEIIDDAQQKISNDTSAANTAAKGALDAANAIADTNYTKISDAIPAAKLTIETSINNANSATERTNSALTSLRVNANNISGGSASTVSDAIVAARTKINQAISNANDRAEAANDAAEECGNKTSLAIQATESANTAATAAISVTTALRNLSVSAESVSPDTGASVISTSDSSGNLASLKFNIPRGQAGKATVIKGPVYATLQALTTAVPNPEEGDVYQVGQSEPYSLYRFTGTTWTNMGSITSSISYLDPNDVRDIYRDSTENIDPPTYEGLEYLSQVGLFTLFKNYINTKVEQVEGKGLSTNDFTQEDKSQISTNTQNITSLASTKVDKIEGKGLSSNDYTSADKTALSNHSTWIGDVVNLKTSSQVLTNAINELYDRAPRIFTDPTELGLTGSGNTVNDIYLKMYQFTGPCIFLGVTGGRGVPGASDANLPYAGGFIIIKSGNTYNIILALRGLIAPSNNATHGFSYNYFIVNSRDSNNNPTSFKLASSTWINLATRRELVYTAQSTTITSASNNETVTINFLRVFQYGAVLNIDISITTGANWTGNSWLTLATGLPAQETGSGRGFFAALPPYNATEFKQSLQVRASSSGALDIHGGAASTMYVGTITYTVDYNMYTQT